MHIWEKTCFRDNFKLRKDIYLHSKITVLEFKLVGIHGSYPHPLSVFQSWIWFSDLPCSVSHSERSFWAHISAYVMSGCNQFQIKVESSVLCQGNRASWRGPSRLSHWHAVGVLGFEQLRGLKWDFIHWKRSFWQPELCL